MGLPERLFILISLASFSVSLPNSTSISYWALGLIVHNSLELLEAISTEDTQTVSRLFTKYTYMQDFVKWCYQAPFTPSSKNIQDSVPFYRRPQVTRNCSIDVWLYKQSTNCIKHTLQYILYALSRKDTIDSESVILRRVFGPFFARSYSFPPAMCNKILLMASIPVQDISKNIFRMLHWNDDRYLDECMMK